MMMLRTMFSSVGIIPAMSVSILIKETLVLMYKLLCWDVVGSIRAIFHGFGFASLQADLAQTPGSSVTCFRCGRRLGCCSSRLNQSDS